RRVEGDLLGSVEDALAAGADLAQQPKVAQLSELRPGRRRVGTEQAARNAAGRAGAAVRQGGRRRLVPHRVPPGRRQLFQLVPAGGELRQLSSEFGAVGQELAPGE